MKTPNEDAIGIPAELSVSLIDFDPKNRKDHDKVQLESLRDSIEAEGLLQPVVVRNNPTKPGRYTLVAGERRLRAVLMLKREKIIARLITKSDDFDAAKKRLVENGQREDLTPIEEARGFRELYVDHKLGQEEIGKLAGGKSQSYVANALRLLDLPGPVQDLVQDGELTRAHGVSLVRFAKWPKICLRIAALVIKNHTTSRELEDASLPFSNTLEREKLVVDCNPYTYDRPDYVVPPKLTADPAFIKAGHRGYFCLEPEKWAPEKAAQDAKFAERAKVQAKQEVGRQNKMTPTEKVARQKKIISNKLNRAGTRDRLAAAEARLATVKDFDAAAVRVVVDAAWTVFNEEDLELAAKGLGMNLPKKLHGDSVDGLTALSPPDLIRLTAAAIARSRAGEALRWAGVCPEEIQHLVGKAKAPPMTTEVIVSLGNDNRARAGSATASSTSSPAEAARQAAAKAFGCKPEAVKVKQTSRKGDTAKFTATKGGA